MTQYRAKLKVDNLDEWVEYLNDLREQGVELQDPETGKINPIALKFDFKFKYEKMYFNS